MDVKDIQKDIAKSQAAIRTLRAESVNYVTFLPSGKVQILDKERLEAINSEAERLTGLVERNFDVLHHLEAVLESFNSIQAVDERHRYVERHIAKVHSVYSVDLGTYLKDFRTLGRAIDLDSDPRAIQLKAVRDEKLSTLEPELKSLSERATAARSIIKGFEGSGLPDAVLPVEAYNQAIARAAMGGLV